MGVEGFSADSALLYHAGLPTAIVDSPSCDAAPPAHRSAEPAADAPPPQTHKLDARRRRRDHRPAVPAGQRRLPHLLRRRRPAVARSTATPSATSASTSRPGPARFESSFGALDVGRGDYVILPTSTIHRLVPTGAPARCGCYVIEATGHIGPPKRYLSAKGQFLESSPYCERDLRAPDRAAAGSRTRRSTVLVQHRQGWTRLTYAHHPFDVVGWDGCLYPYAFNIADFEPHHRPGAPAAARAPDVRGLRTS